MNEKFYIKQKKDKGKIFLNESFGVKVIEIDNIEDIDKALEEIEKKGKSTVFISNEMASFSNNIIKKYEKDQNIRIIIS